MQSNSLVMVADLLLTSNKFDIVHYYRYSFYYVREWESSGRKEEMSAEN